MVEVLTLVEDAIAERIGAELSTVTTTDEVARLPEVSFATAEIVCEPSIKLVESHDIEYGDAEPGEPVLALSTLNWILCSAILSDAVAESVTVVLPTVAPFIGAVSETIGAVMSAEVRLWSDDVEVLPMLSVETTAK